MSIKYHDGQVVFSLDDDYEIESAIRHITATTEVGKDYAKNYYTTANCDSDYDKIVAGASQIAGGSFIHEGHLQHALTLLIDSGELKPKKFIQAAPLEEPVEDTRPRDKNGKLLTPQQIQWSEFRRFADQASMSEINLRKQSDPEFANYVRKALQVEMNQEIGDAVTSAGSPTAKTRVNQNLVDFARKYNAEPSQNLKPRGGFVLLAGEQLPYSQFLELVNAATNARLL